MYVRGRTYYGARPSGFGLVEFFLAIEDYISSHCRLPNPGAYFKAAF